jgi:hypothetical protein
MTDTHPGGETCVDHPELASSRTCIVCGRGFCQYCGYEPLVLRRKVPENPIVCRHCTERTKPWVWNEYAADEDEEPGEHLGQALWNPREAMLRAGYGKVPIGALGMVLWLGSMGAAWIGVELAVGGDETVAAAARFGYGVGWSFVGLVCLTAWAGSLHALQPPGPGRAATFLQTLQVTATAFYGPALVALVAGGAAFLSSNVWSNEVGVIACAVSTGLGVGWGIVLAGWGMAVRRGSKVIAGLASAFGATVAAAVILGLMLWIRANPPWGAVFEQTQEPW